MGQALKLSKNESDDLVDGPDQSEQEVIDSFFDDKPQFLKDFMSVAIDRASKKGLSLEQYIDQATDYLLYMPNYIPSLDDAKTVDDDPFSTVNADVRQKLEAVLGCAIPMPPPGYSYTDNTLYKQKPNDEEAVCSLIFVVARGFNTELGVWAVRLVFLDHFNEPVVLDLPSETLQKQAELTRLLLAKGMRIFSNGQKFLPAYLTSLNPLKRMEVFHRQGLVQNSQGYYYYIVGDEIIGDEDGDIMYLPNNSVGLKIPKHSKGTLEQWQQFVVMPCRGSNLPTFLFCLGFVPVVTKALNRSSFAASIYGDSSKGKTSSLQACATTLGPGGDPSKNQLTCINNCNHTNNHMAALAQASDSQLLLLDEVGTAEGKEVGKLLLVLTGGQQRGRATAAGKSQGGGTWFTIPVLTAEQSLLSYIRESDGELRNGHIARILDIPIGAESVFTPNDGSDSADVADQVKIAAQQYYGTAFKAFAKYFVDWTTTDTDWQEKCCRGLDTLAELYRAQVDRPHEKRAAENFAVVHYAGKLAIAAGILPFSDEEIATSVQYALDQWKDGLGGKDELDYEVDKLRLFFADNQRKFINPKSDVSKADHVGYVFTIDKVDYFGIECSRFDAELSPKLSKCRLLDRLEDNGLLLRLEGDRRYCKRKVAGKGDLKLYLVSQSILST